jgi:hypothetical protein
LEPKRANTAVAMESDAVAMRYDVQNPTCLSKKVAGMEEREAMFVNLWQVLAKYAQVRREWK